MMCSDIEEESIDKDRSHLTDHEKHLLLTRDAPELQQLLEELREKLAEIQDFLKPIIDR
jgi:hypothetical protein